MSNSEPSLEIGTETPQKFNIGLPRDPVILPVNTCPKGLKAGLGDIFVLFMFVAILFTKPKGGNNQVSTDRRVDK